MASKKGAFALTDFVSNLFSNIPKLLLTNLLFALPFAVCFGIFYFINVITNINSNFILFLTAIPLFPFYAGVTQVTAHMVRGEENIDVFSNFVSGVKENFKRFIVHGVVFYAAIFFSYYSIVLYSGFGKTNNIFYALLGLCILITVIFLFMFYYVPSMTVTFDISMKNIYKNSALMSLGELKHNLLATFGIIILALICATVLFCCQNVIALIIATVALALLIVPSFMSFIINSAIYKNMFSMIATKDERSQVIDKKMENRRNGQFIDNFETDKKPSVAQDFSGVEIDETKDGNEYIYYNGKMIKRSVLLKLKKEAEETEE